MDSEESKQKCRYCLTDPATRPCLDGIKCCNELVICDTCEKKRAEVGEAIRCMTLHDVLRPPSKKALQRRADEELEELREQFPEGIEILRELRNIILLERMLEQLIEYKFNQLMIEHIQEEKQENWTCSICTFINSGDTLHCTMCITEREGIQKWKCSWCQHMNIPSIDKCSLCRTSRPNE